MKKCFIIILVVLIFCGILSGCYDKKEIDEMAYVMAIGLDKGKTNTVRITIQYVKPSSVGGGGGEGDGGGGENTVDTMTVESPTFFSALNMFNVSLAKELNISHAKILVFSKELAEEGIDNYLYGFSRGREFRPNLNIVISRTSAEEYLKSIKPVLESDPSKYYDLNYTSYKYTGFTADADLFSFQSKMKSYGVQPIAVLAGVERFKSPEEFDSAGATSEEKGRSQIFEGNYKAGDVPKIGGGEGQIMGMAVFHGSKMVGELDGEETQCYLMVTGDFRHAYITYPDPLDNRYFLILDVKQNRPPRHRVEIIDGKPRIHIDILLEADYLAIQSGINYEAPENAKIFEEFAEAFQKKSITHFLNKTAKEFKSDICGFGNKAAGMFLTWNEWAGFNWTDKYKDATFDISIDLKVRRTGLNITTTPIIASEGRQ